MNTYIEYYTNYLYPLQSGIIRKIVETGSRFYLTGGTALSRCYFHHRYSDDLDFFVNNDREYSAYVKTIIDHLIHHQKETGFIIDTDNIIAGKHYTKIMIMKNDPAHDLINLQIDLVNDTAFHFGDIIDHKEFGRIDNIRNILSNKITALYRLEPKDVVDIRIIANGMKFQWPEIFTEAKKKELGVDPVSVSAIIRDFPEGLLDVIKWENTVDRQSIMEDLKVISEDILLERENRLYKPDSD